MTSRLTTSAKMHPVGSSMGPVTFHGDSHGSSRGPSKFHGATHGTPREMPWEIPLIVQWEARCTPTRIVCGLPPPARGLDCVAYGKTLGQLPWGGPWGLSTSMKRSMGSSTRPMEVAMGRFIGAGESHGVSDEMCSVLIGLM